jgi:flagellar motor switch protein FliN/FliY
MPELNSSAVDSFIEAVKNGAEESASAFTRTFGATVAIAPKEGGKFNDEQFAPRISEKGLALLMKVGTQGIAILLPASTGLIPDWCDAPDATGKSKLATFAQEWAMNLVPADDFFPDDQQSAVIQNLSQGLTRSMLEEDAGYVELALGKEDGTSVAAYMVWALSTPDQLLEDPKPVVEEIPAAPPMGGAPSFGGQADPFANTQFGTPNFVGGGSGGGLPQHHRLEDLPGYARSVLKVKIPVATILARARKPIKAILELGVGSIIQFDKSCDEMLEIEVGQAIVIATAEAVKVGDKFGFRISTVMLPEERFRRVEVRREGEYKVKSDSPQIIGKAPIKSFDKKR